jgi:hypothetical protein
MPRSTTKPNAVFTVILISIIIFFFVLKVTRSEMRGFLGVDGEKVVDASGNTVFLKGVNLEFKNFKTVLKEHDLLRISDMGANSIRLVLDYRDFETSPFLYNKEGFALLDAILGWCEKYRLAVILDLHLAPGIQNPHDFVVHREKTYRFWDKSDFQERFYSLWEEIARRYAERTIIAGYDLLNEGMPPSIKDYQHVMNSVVTKIRTYDKKHMLIVEEAILPDWTKELVLLDDRNILYSIHFFYPPEFSFYATTTRRPLATYPGEMAIAGEPLNEIKSKTIAGNTSWRQLQIQTTPPEGSEILIVKIESGGDNGHIWFDDVHLSVDGKSIDLPAPLIRNNSFEIDYPGFTWDTNNSCVTVSEQYARTGKHSLAFSGCTVPVFAQSSPLQVKKGTYALTAWYRSENATGDTALSLSWHKKKIVAVVDRKSLQKRFHDALKFRKKNHVPLYVGEFTAHINPSTESITNYLRDILDIMEHERLHWSFWEYYSLYPGVGILTGNDPHIINQAAFDVLTMHMKK